MASKKSDVTKQVEKEHQTLIRNIAELMLSIMENISTRDFPDWRIQFICRLRDFKQSLMNHFEFEEQGGFMQELTSVAPQFLDKVKELEDEHRQILSNIDGIFKDFESLQVKDDLKLQDIRNRVTKVITSLRQHVSAENHLMQTAYYQEYGSPD